MFTKLKWIYVLLIISLFLSSWTINGCNSCTKPKRLDHFKVYKVENIKFDSKVLLKGQFDKGEIDARLLALTHFANPVIKKHSGRTTKIGDPNAHLNWYFIKQRQPEPRRTVWFENQFGKYHVVIKDPRFLLVPAQKISDKDSEFPENLDHYKCYEVISSRQISKISNVGLEDQFGAEDDVKISKLRFFCVPVIKNHKTVNQPLKIFNPKDHLAVYEIEQKPYKQQIKVKDQFDSFALQVIRSEMLAVPSQKERDEETPPVKLDHFKIYEVDSIGCDITVMLKGQFDQNEITGQLTTLTHFANPAEKDHKGTKTEIRDSTAHFNWYTFKQEEKEPRRLIQFNNQFGRHILEIGNPRYLLVPAQKISDAGSVFPDSLDHYKCYQVTSVKEAPEQIVVLLTDQFVSEDTVQVQRPRFFCVPVSKNISGDEPRGRVMNSENYLVIYYISHGPFKHEIKVKDQFKELELKTIRSVMLAVPTNGLQVKIQD